MKNIKSILKRVQNAIADYQATIRRCEQGMRDGWDPIDIEELRVSLKDLWTIEYLLNEIIDRSKQKSHQEADEGDDDDYQ